MHEQKRLSTRVLALLVLATAMAAGGVAETAVTTSTRATAAPCSSWRSKSQNLAFTLSNGQTAIFELNIDGNQFSNNDRDAILQVPGSDGYNGNAQGLIAGNNGRIDFTVIWTPKSGEFGGPDILSQQIKSRFIGEIAEDGTARGTADDNKNAHVNWNALGAFTCADTAPNPADPAAQPDDPPAPTTINCDDPAAFEANKGLCELGRSVVLGPTDAVTMDIDVNLAGADITIINTSPDISGTCTYDATSPGLPGVTKTFDLAKSGTVKFSTLKPLPFTTYHVVLSCTGQWNGKTVEFGHREKNVTAEGTD